MSAKLIMDENNYGSYSIYWWLTDTGDIGACLGEGSDKHGNSRYEDMSEETREDEAVCKALAKTKGVEHKMGGFCWESKSHAQAALRVAKLALKELKANRAWPEWATQAAAAGWKPPKGWTP